ncbi:hypothetical protein Mal35_16830 [Gimesia maris]|nr:hypothetical protein Mal35_16830 [Gimesia maris]
MPTSRTRIITGVCCPCLAIIAITTVLVVAWKYWPNTRSCGQVFVPRKHVSSQQLIATVDKRLAVEKDHIQALKEEQSQMATVERSLRAQVLMYEEEIQRRRIELLRYAELINDDEGIILQDGSYISAESVRSRAEQRRSQFLYLESRTRRIIELTSQLRHSCAETKELMAIRERNASELKSIRDELVNIIEHCELPNNTIKR